MRYLLGTLAFLTPINRQECLDQGTSPDAVTQYRYAVKETATQGTFAILVDDDKNPIAVGDTSVPNGYATSSVEPEWPAPPDEWLTTPEEG